jgi:hypothetical protein
MNRAAIFVAGLILISGGRSPLYGRPGAQATPQVLIALFALLAGTRMTSTPDVETIRRYEAPEATQAVAVDDQFYYAIGSAAIGKYDKRSGQRVGAWEGTPGGAVAHLNSGVVFGNELYAAHSNYPATPMVSSIEVFDTTRVAHVRSIPLPAGIGSATWVDRLDGDWWVTFAHYAGRGGERGKGPEHTTLVRFDGEWQRRGTWSFPAAVVERWDGMSSSGGTWGRDRRLYTTGHHAPELYVLSLPESGRQLKLDAIIPIESEGQGIAFDRGAGLLYSIQRRTHEVLVSKLPS